MPNNSPLWVYDLETLKGILISAAKEILLPGLVNVKRRHKADGSIVTDVDIAMQQRIAKQLQQHWPDTVFLGEEMSSQAQQHQLEADRPVWCLDPLDGTSNFAAGIPCFAISLALLYQGQIQLGVVYDPMRGELFAAYQNQGATLNGVALSLQPSGLALKQAIGIIDFKRLPEKLAMRIVREAPYASQRSFGSVALDWCWLAAGRGHVYIHGKQKIWDYAAGYLIFQEAGGYASTLSGEAVFVNELIPRSAVAAVDKALFDAWQRWLGIAS